MATIQNNMYGFKDDKANETASTIKKVVDTVIDVLIKQKRF